MTFFGDGATSEGDFHEALNCAAVYQAPVIFICQNNQWAISVPLARQTLSATLAQKALAYGMPGIQVDGNDILAVYAATAEAVERARAGGGPTFIECVTYRIMMHTTADDPKKYRSEQEVEAWKIKDPLLRYQKYLLQKNIVTEDDMAALEEEVKKQIQTAIDRAEQQMNELGHRLTCLTISMPICRPPLADKRLNWQVNWSRAIGRCSMAKMTMVEALNLALRQEMAKDDAVLLLGQDIGRDGGVFRVTDQLIDAVRQGTGHRYAFSRSGYCRNGYRHGCLRSEAGL